MQTHRFAGSGRFQRWLRLGSAAQQWRLGILVRNLANVHGVMKASDLPCVWFFVHATRSLRLRTTTARVLKCSARGQQFDCTVRKKNTTTSTTKQASARARAPAERVNCRTRCARTTALGSWYARTARRWRAPVGRSARATRSEPAARWFCCSRAERDCRRERTSTAAAA